MMVNTVPSYCVSLDILLSEYSIGSSRLPRQAGGGDQKRCVSSITSAGNSSRKYVKRKTDEVISAELQYLVEGDGKKSSDGFLNELRKYGESPVLHSKRWLVLTIYCCISFMQVMVWNTWSPIASAVLYAFPTWTPGTVALFNNWGCISFILFIIPTCWVLNEKGLRTACLIGSCLCTIGSGIRCITLEEKYFTILAHIGAVMNAIAGVFFGPSSVLLSSTWFPANQRASATGAGTAISALGMAVSYLIGPFMITLPSPDYEYRLQRVKIKEEIQTLMYIHFGIHLVLLWLIVFLFPGSPTRPPSQSSSLSLNYHRSFVKSIKKLMKNCDIWLLGISAALCSGMTGPWLSQLPIIFSHRNFTPTELARLGFWTIISSCLFSLTATRFSDMFQGHIKAILSGLLAFATVMFICILYLVNLPDSEMNKLYLIQAVIAGFSATWASSPLFYELGAEIAYPVPDGIVAGYLMSMCSVSCVVVYTFFYTCTDSVLIWLNYGLVFYNVASFLCLCHVHEQYNRLSLDD